MGITTTIPPRLEAGGHVRVIAPSLPLSCVSPEIQARANGRISCYLGATVSFGNVEATDVQSRYYDLRNAFLDDRVDAIFPTCGGFNSNDILAYCHHNPQKGEELWRIIEENPKERLGSVK